MSTECTLRAAAQAVLDRWDSPQWQWTKHGPTADLMANLRVALDADLNLQVESAITQVQAVHAAFNAGALQQPAASGEPVTLADVLDALNLFNRPKPSEDDGPWEGGHYIRVDHLPDFINVIAAAWFAPQPAPARVPPDQPHPQR